MRHTKVRIAMILVVLTAVCAWGAAEMPEKKVTVKASDLPTAIKKAIKEAFPKGKILAVEKEVQGKDPGQYDVEIQSQGKVYEVEISPAGTLIEAKQISEAAEAVDGGKEKTGDGEMKWTSDFQVDKRRFSATGRNRFFSLEPGHQIVIESKSEKVIITVLDETKKIGSVVTRVIEERESEDGKLVEVSRNFFAICKATSDVFYFGEEVDDYKDGKIVDHGGAWRADKKGSKAGIIMPGTVLLGARHYQEIAPNAMDRAEIIADDVTMKTPAGTFKNCIRVKETSPLEPGSICYKTYAPGIGLIQDEDLLLTAYSKGAEEKIALKDLPKAAPVNCPACAMGLTAELVFKRLDSNEDKSISAKEFAGSPGISSVDEAHGAVGRIDTNGNGTLSWQEFEKAYTQRHAKCIKPAGPATPAQQDQRGNMTRFAQVFIMRSDTNGDGKLDKSEFRGSQARFDQMDANKNGFIDPDELKVLHERRMNDPKTMRERLNSGDMRQHQPRLPQPGADQDQDPRR